MQPTCFSGELLFICKMGRAENNTTQHWAIKEVIIMDYTAEDLGFTPEMVAELSDGKEEPV